MSSSPSLGLCFGFAAALLLGCGDDARGTPGQLGHLRFTYGCDGCQLEHEVLAGSALELRVDGVNPKVRYEVRSSAPERAAFTVTGRCTFVGQDDCHQRVHAALLGAGDVELEVVDAWTETLFDRITLHVRDAAAIASQVRVDGRVVEPSSSGRFELAVGSDVEIHPVARSASGSELIATAGALHSAYADETVVGPLHDEGHLERARARAKAAGVTTVSVIAHGAKQELPFVVR